MELYNYESKNKRVDELLILAENLSQKEVEAALNAIKESKLSDSVRIQANYIEWFEQAILPVLKDFAKLSTAILQIEKNGNSNVIAMIIGNGFDITDTCGLMKWILTFADHVGINMQEDKIALTLIFDFQTL